MVNKRGWLRIIEAGIGILIIIGVLLIINRNNSAKVEPDLSFKMSRILEEIAKNPDLRQKVTSNAAGIETELEKFISDKINRANLMYRVRVCDISQDCSLDKDTAGKKDISTAERIISTTIDSSETGVSPKRVRAFSWES